MYDEKSWDFLNRLEAYEVFYRLSQPYQDSTMVGIAAWDEAQAVDASTIARTSSGKLRPTARPALGTRLVAVMPGAVLTSRM